MPLITVTADWVREHYARIGKPNPLEAQAQPKESARKHKRTAGITSESEEQQNVMAWAKEMEFVYPELELLHHVPNGGMRSKGTAGKLRAEGVKPGVPDLCLPVARNGFHGLYIEMKAANGKPSGKQLEWIRRLIAQGYYAAICYRAPDAVDVIIRYLGLDIRT